MPKASKLRSLSLFRCAILLNGETAQPPWWSSTAARQGASDFRFAFPRTAMTAAFTRAAELAKTLHDQRTRQQDYYHLFRLPHAIEADIHRETLLLEQNGELSSDKIAVFFDDFLREATIHRQVAEGAVDCGTITLSRNSDLKRVGILYREAFRNGTVCLPYFRLTL